MASEVIGSQSEQVSIETLNGVDLALRLNKEWDNLQPQKALGLCSKAKNGLEAKLRGLNDRVDRIDKFNKIEILRALHTCYQRLLSEAFYTGFNGETSCHVVVDYTDRLVGIAKELECYGVIV